MRAAARPRTLVNQYHALQNSGNVRHVRKLQPEFMLSGLDEGPGVPFSQIERIQGPYPVVVDELIPAQLQAEFSQLSGHVRNEVAAAGRAPLG